MLVVTSLQLLYYAFINVTLIDILLFIKDYLLTITILLFAFSISRQKNRAARRRLVCRAANVRISEYRTPTTTTFRFRRLQRLTL